ncbi:MAG: hypothetical protein Q7R84_01540 [bacterium]|nr:hypothetical protein [bacterium]
MAKKNLPNVGDVIMSPRFAYGYRDGEHNKIIAVDGKTMKHPVTYYLSEDERVNLARKTGVFPPRKKTIDLSACDPSRTTAKFIVETARMQGGGTGHGPNDIYPDGWHIQARRLNKDGSYDPNGEVIHFYMSGCFTNIVEPKDIKVVGKMQMMFI